MMKTAVFNLPGKIEIREVPLPEPGTGEIRVQLEGCGVCASNLPVWEGRPWFTYPLAPGTPGHEAWGRVDKLGKGVEGFHVGERVTLLSQQAYAEYDTADAKSTVSIASLSEYEPFPGEPLGCAMNIFSRSRIQPGHTVAVVGVGFLGALLTSLAVKAGARVLAVSRRAFALEIGLCLGAEQAVAMDDSGGALDLINKYTEGRGCDVVIECTGEQEPLDLAGEMTAVRGRLVIAGYHQDGKRQVNMQLWNWRGLDVINAHERDPGVYVQGIRRAVEARARDAIDPAPLFTHRLPLEELSRAFILMRERPEGFIKALLTYDR